MPYREYLAKLGFDERELANRRSFYQLTDDDLARLAALRSMAEKYNDRVVEDFYVHLLGHAESRAFFPDEATKQRAMRAQKQYFLGLFSGRCDLAYVEDRLRVGATHERLGISPKWYLGAYAHYLRLIWNCFASEIKNPEEALRAYRSFEKIVFFDMAIAIETYVAAGLESVARHQAAIRELSTPVIRVYEKILLLPLIGTIDTQRALQVMESVLMRVVEEQAKAIIIDIAGIPVVDTRVADHLLQTTAAVRLLGAETILTGISPQVARTIVQLGVNISTMHTSARLEEGLELALGLVGKSVRPKEAEAKR